jgi:hypothetical protein
VTTTARITSKAEAAFKKEEQLREGQEAMAEYRAAALAEEKKTARLRALRLAKERSAAPAALVPKPRPSKSR